MAPEQSLDLTEAGLSKVVASYPSLLGFNTSSNLGPTIDFYINSIESDEQWPVIIDLLARNPRLLGSSLEKRLKPRLAEAQEAGLTIDAKCLQRMAKYTEDRWTTSLEYQSRLLGNSLW